MRDGDHYDECPMTHPDHEWIGCRCGELRAMYADIAADRQVDYRREEWGA